MEGPENGVSSTTAEPSALEETDVANCDTSVNDTSAPKPLKSILKKRKQENESVAVRTDDSADELPPVIQKPKGGSITAALKMITSISHGSEDEDDDTNPKPSAFILEMEKQKDQLPVVVPGAFSFPNRLEGIEVADMDWQSTSSQPNSFFERQQIEEKERKAYKQKNNQRKPAKRTKIKITKGPLTMLTPHDDTIEGVVLINNLPYKVTVEEMIKVLGIWPKGGYKGIKLITDKSAFPAGFGYVIVERHSDMMDILRLTGLDFKGRIIRCGMSDRNDLIHDWKTTKKALAELDKSRVIRVAQLPFYIKKSELVKLCNKVKFSEDDIFWSPLVTGQTNSGRGFVILQSSEDAKAIASEKNLKANGRKLEISQVHPLDFERFCSQCQMEMKFCIEDLIDPITEDLDDVSDLNLGEETNVREHNVTSENPSANFVVVDGIDKTKNLSDRSSETKKRKRRERDLPKRSMPPFEPTVFVRMYNVPDKANFEDIRIFFDPMLPARINKGMGPNMYDIEFYKPEEAMRAMRKHTLLMRKNVISLEMLPGPPNPFPPRHFSMPQGVGPGPFPPAMVPMGSQPLGTVPPGMGPLPPGTMPPGMGLPPPGTMPPGMGPPPSGAMPPAMGMSPMGPPPVGPTRPLPMPGLAPPTTGSPMLGPGGPLSMPMVTPGSMFGPALPPVLMVPPDSTNRLPKTAVDPESRHKSPVDPRYMPPPMRARKDSEGSRKSTRSHKRSPPPDLPVKPKKEMIPVPPLPEDFTRYEVPPYKEDTPVGQGVITTMQGYFCQLCNKFYSSKASAKDAHCKTRGHYDRLKQFYQEKKRLRRLAENEVKKR